jgi:serine/threonine protein kinase
LIGKSLAHYEINEMLGKGGMGEVYRARDTKLGRDVAIKFLPADMAADRDRLARFEQEARTVASLNHPNIVTLFSIESEADTRFLTMELVEGKSLDHHLVPGGLPVERVVELGVTIADALSAAHENGIVHRDLKPANVMLADDGTVKVLDFGIAKLEQSEADDPVHAATVAAVTGDGQVTGTLPYMAPEQLRGEANWSRRDGLSSATPRSRSVPPSCAIRRQRLRRFERTSPPISTASYPGVSKRILTTVTRARMKS